jgi:anti-sigma regulatory factor (Ser/Thr protein kinase)
MAADRPERSLPPAKFPPEPASITVARHRLEDFLYDVPMDVRNVAALLASELASNVILHAHTHFSLCADVTPFGLRVEVADGNSNLPVVMHPEPTEPGGRGMMLVSELADSWGTQPIPDGKLVWFELSLGKSQDLSQGGDL